MTTIQTNSKLEFSPSSTTSHLESFKQCLGIVPAPSTLLLKELDSQKSLSDSTLLKIVAFLADHPHTKLEQTLKEKLAKTPPSETLAKVKTVCRAGLLKNHLQMVEVCKRIVSLDQLKSAFNCFDPMATAQRESSIIPARVRTTKKISDTAIQNWHKYSNIFGKAIHWAQTMLAGVVIALVTALSYPVYNQLSTFSAIEGYLKNCSSIINGFTKLTTSYLGFFATKEKAALAGVVILISATLINYIHKRFRLGVPEQIDGQRYFKNTRIEVQNGQILKMKGRHEEKEHVKTAWNVPPKEKFRIVLLVGPKGCGKSEFVNGLAWESVKDPDSFVFGKTIFTINMINLVKGGVHYLNEVFTNIKGCEDDIVLFFDEGHTAGSEKGKIGPVLENLKTTLLDKNIRAILATTPKEYEDNIQHNEAFVDRCSKVDFKEMTDVESKKILKSKVELDVDREIEVDADTYDAMLLVASRNPARYNPRKVIDLYKDIRSYVYGWKPKKLSQELERQTTKRDDLDAQCKKANHDPKWSDSREGIALLDELKEQENKVQESTQKLKTQKADLDKIARLRSLGPQYRKQYNEVVHRLIAEKKEELLKEFLYLKHVLRPALQDTLESAAQSMTKLYEEELPLKIDAALIKKLYPDAFSTPEDSSTAQSKDPLENKTSSA